MKISVVIPNYNHAHWLPDSIESALGQTLPPLEVIVVDDGSKDNSQEVASKYPVKYVYKQNAGLSAARNTGIEAAQGDWIAFLDADDIWHKDKLKIQAEAVGDAEVCYCATTRFFNDGHTEDAEFFDARQGMKVLMHHNFIDPSSVIVHRKALDRVGGFKVGMPAAEDWEMWLRLARDCKFVGVPKRLLSYRVTGTGMSADPLIVLRSMDDLIAAATFGKSGIARFIQASRMKSVRTNLAALKFRDKGDHRNTLRYAWQAFCCWPSPFYDKAFTVILLELRHLLLRAIKG